MTARKTSQVSRSAPQRSGTFLKARPDQLFLTITSSPIICYNLRGLDIVLRHVGDMLLSSLAAKSA